MTGTPLRGPQRRRSAFVDERMLGQQDAGQRAVLGPHDRPADHADEDVIASIQHRRRQLAAYRELVRASKAAARKAAAPPEGLIAGLPGAAGGPCP